MPAGLLEKLKIYALDKIDAKAELTSPNNIFVAYFNPESYSVSYGIEYDEEEGISSTGSEMKFKKQVARTYSFELVLDNTSLAGVSLSNPIVMSVQQRVDLLEKISYQYEGEIHRPRYLMISWGTLSARVVLETMDVTYNLFFPDGTPLRARVNVAFREVVSQELMDAQKRNASPDLSHRHIVKDGDTLPNLCNSIYGDPGLYLQVATYNNLNNYRKLRPGSELYFPPVIRE